MNARWDESGPPSRRRVLQVGLGWLAASAFPKAGHAAAVMSVADRTLVLLHLSGGNDGLNTLVPYADPLYYEMRPRLSRVARKVLAINGKLGFHPCLSGLHSLYRRGCLAIVQGVGYANPDYSHVGSCRIWRAGNKDLYRGLWEVGASAPTGRPIAKPVGPIIAGDGTSIGPADGRPIGYSPGQTAEVLAGIVRELCAARPPRLLSVSVGGFDTHEDQLEAHGQILHELGDGLAAFQRELEERGVADRVVLMAWSEFGRRPTENAMGGTDHGAAGPVFLLGRCIKGGLYGRTPSLSETDFGNLIATVDFRAVHAALGRRWFQCTSVGRNDVC